MNVFVLCAGRTGSTTFAHACNSIQGMTAGHETRVEHLFSDRLEYPQNHVEVDNRLAFFLGMLDSRYGNNAHYVYLKREREEIAKSYRKRWYYKGSIVRAFHFNIMQSDAIDAKAFDEACRFYVDVNDANIRHFLKDKSKVFYFDLADARSEFRRFIDWLGVDCADEGFEAWDVSMNLNKARNGKLGAAGHAKKALRLMRAIPRLYWDI